MRTNQKMLLQTRSQSSASHKNRATWYNIENPRCAILAELKCIDISKYPGQDLTFHESSDADISAAELAAEGDVQIPA